MVVVVVGCRDLVEEFLLVRVRIPPSVISEAGRIPVIVIVECPWRRTTIPARWTTAIVFILLLLVIVVAILGEEPPTADGVQHGPQLGVCPGRVEAECVEEAEQQIREKGLLRTGSEQTDWLYRFKINQSLNQLVSSQVLTLPAM